MMLWTRVRAKDGLSRSSHVFHRPFDSPISHPPFPPQYITTYILHAFEPLLVTSCVLEVAERRPATLVVQTKMAEQKFYELYRGTT